MTASNNKYLFRQELFGSLGCRTNIPGNWLAPVGNDHSKTLQHQTKLGMIILGRHFILPNLVWQFVIRWPLVLPNNWPFLSQSCAELWLGYWWMTITFWWIKLLTWKSFWQNWRKRNMILKVGVKIHLSISFVNWRFRNAKFFYHHFSFLWLFNRRVSLN